MARRYFNWKLAIVLLVGVMVLGVTAYALRQWQKETRAERGLELGTQAYDEQRYEEAAEHLGSYVGVYKDNVPAMLKYADAHLNIRPLKRNNVQQAIGTYNIILRQEETNSEAAGKLVGIHLSMKAFGEAERIAKEFLDKTDDLEVRKMYATALARQRKFSEAIVEFRSVIAAEPNQVMVYGYLGQLAGEFPADFAQNETEAYWHDEAVRKNPDSALAYILRAAFYLKTGEKEKALVQLDEAEKLDLSEGNVRIMLADQYLSAGLIEKAEEHLITIKEKNPRSSGLWNTWAKLAIRSNSKQKAIEVAEDGLESLSAMPWDFMPRAAELFIMAGELKRAVECIEELNKKDISPWTVAGLRAMLAEQKGDLRDAAKYWQQSVSQGNTTAQAQLNLAAALSAMGDTQSAIRQLNTFLAQTPNSPQQYSTLAEGHLALAKLLVKTGDWAGVAENTRTALQLAPRSSAALLLNLQARVQLLGEADADSQAWDEIIAGLSPLKASEGTAMQARLLELQIMIQRGQFDAAGDLMPEIKKEYPSQYKVAMAEVGLLMAQEKREDAIEMLNQIVEDFPEVAEPVRFLALMLDGKGKPQEGEAVIEQALERMTEPLARLELGLLLVRLYDKWGRPDDSYALLEDISKEDPNSIPVRRMMLNTRAIAEDSEKAQKLVDELRAIEGENGWQWRLEQTRVWFNGDEFDKRSSEIISLLKENLLANSDDVESRILLAKTYQRSDRLETALATYREAISRFPKDERVIVATVLALWEAREDDEADEILTRASKEGITSSQLQELHVQSLVRRGELDSAADMLHQDLMADPNNALIGLSLASVKRMQIEDLVRRGELDSAADMLNEELVSEPNNVAMGLFLVRLKTVQNKFDEAKKLLDELRERDPNALPILGVEVELYVREGKIDEALKLCDRMVKDHSNASAYAVRARVYVEAKQVDKAGEDFDRAVAAEPNNANAWVARSNFYVQTGQKAKAVADIEKALELVPDNRAVQIRTVDMLLDAGTSEKRRKAQAIVNRSLEANPKDSELRLRKARTLLAQATAPAIREAVGTLEELTEDNPEFVDAWQLLASVLMKQGLTARAIDTILQGLVHNEKDKDLLMLKAHAEASKSPFLAIATLEQLSVLDPNNITIILRLADTYVATGEAAKAESLLRDYLTKCEDPYKRVCRTGLAVAMYSNNKKSEAKAEFDALSAEEPNDPTPSMAMVKIFEKDKLWDRMESQAVDWYRKHPRDVRTALAMAKMLVSNKQEAPQKAGENLLRLMFKDHPKDIRVVATLAILMQTYGRDDEAAKFYRRVIEIKPDDVVSINNLAWIICENQGKHAEALELAQKGLTLAPNYIDLIDTRGVAYYRMGKFNEAIRDFSNCIKLYPEDTAAVTASHFHLGRAMAKAKQIDDAVENLNKALRLNEDVGGLSPDDLNEVNSLLEKLTKEGG